MLHSLGRTAAGLLVLGEDLLLVTASLRGRAVSWDTERVRGFFAEGSTAQVATTALPEKAPRVLVWPTDRMMRREIPLASEPDDALRESVGASLDSFFPTPPDEPLLWDIHAWRDEKGSWRGMVFAVRAADIEPALARLADAGVAPTRLIPSVAAYSTLRLTVPDEPAQAVVEKTRTGWARGVYEGLALQSVTTGRGEPPASGNDTPRCDWTATPDAPVDPGATSSWSGRTHAEHAALGAALLAITPTPEGQRPAPTIDLFGIRPPRRLRITRAGWAGVAAAVAVVALLALNQAWHNRTEQRLAMLEAREALAAPEAEAVAEMREHADAMVTAINRVRTLEERYTPRWRMLAAITEATPRDSYLERIELADRGPMLDASTPNLLEFIAALEGSPSLTGVQRINQPAPRGDGRLGVRVGGSFAFESVAGATQSGSEGAQ